LKLVDFDKEKEEEVDFEKEDEEIRK